VVIVVYEIVYKFRGVKLNRKVAVSIEAKKKVNKKKKKLGDKCNKTVRWVWKETIISGVVLIKKINPMMRYNL